MRSVLLTAAVFVIAGTSLAGDIPRANPFLPSDSLLLRYARTGILGDYDASRACVAELRSGADSSSWAADWAAVLNASLFIAEWADLGGDSLVPLFRAERERAYPAFSRRLEMAESSRDSAAAMFALGTLEGLEAAYREAERGGLSALGPARRSARLLREAFSTDSTLIDAALGFSVYDYWSSRILRVITWTPLKKDRRRQSIARIELVMREGRYSRYLAGVYLSWIRIEENRPEAAWTIADSLLEAVGESRAFLEPAGKAYYLAQRWDEARDRYGRLLLSLENAPRFNPVAAIGALNRLACIAKEQQDWRAVLDFADRAKAINLDDEQLKRKKNDLERIEKLRREAVKALESQRESKDGKR